MKVSILTAADNGSTWSNQTILNPDDLAALLAQGKFIAAARKQPDGESITDKFGQADLLMVRIDLARLPLETALGHDFTQRHASVAAHQLTDDGGTLLLAFELTAPTLKADFYRRLLAGLEALYAGSRHHTDEKQAYGLTAGCTTTVLGNKLDASSQVILDKLGREAMQQRAGKWEGAYLRSRVTLDRSDIFTLATGEEVALQELPNEFEIACPIHIDHKATAVVRWFADGTPGVQCDHCQRTYAAPNTQRDYDFDHFDRILKQLDPTCREDVDIGGVIVEDRPITFLNTRYLPALEIRGADGYLISDAGNGPLEIRRGVTYVKSPKGSGKTEALVPFVEQCKKQHWRVLLIGHRRALLQSMAARLGLDPYFVVEDSATPVRNPSADCLTFADDGDSLTGPPVAAEDDADKPAKYHRLEPTRAYAVCLDSLMGLQPEKDEHKYPVIIIDESEQVFAHLVGETLADSRRAVFARLSHYLKNAAIVVLLDADLNRVTMDAMCAVGRNDTPVRFVVNEYKAEKREIRMYGSSAQLTAELLRRVDDGEKSYVATNSLAMAENLRQLLLQRFPDKVVLVVSSKTSGQKSTQELLADIPSRFRRNLDVLIASPAIGTGVDITFKDQHGEDECIVKNVFGFFSRNIITHLDIDQQLMRVRHPGQVHVWVDATPMNYEVDVDCIRRELERSVRRTNEILFYEDDGTPVYPSDEGLLGIWARVTAAARGSKNRLEPLFRAMRLDGGWSVVDVEHDTEAVENGKAGLAAGKVLRLADREARLLAAASLEQSDANELMERDKKGIALTDSERDELDRYKLESFYDDGISAELIAFDDEGRTRAAIQRLECLVCSREWLANRDREEIGNGLSAFDRKMRVGQRALLGDLFMTAGIYDVDSAVFAPEVQVDRETLRQFTTAVQDARGRIESLFKNPVNDDAQRNPVGQLRSLLKLVGLTIVTSQTIQTAGKKVRRYRLDQDRLAEMLEVIGRRDSKYKRTVEGTKAGDEDSLGLSFDKELRAKRRKSCLPAMSGLREAVARNRSETAVARH